MLCSKLADAADMDDPQFNSWIKKLGQNPDYILKQWEMCYAAQALYERGKLVAGSRGLVFGVGLELLPSYFASIGCKITATDLSNDDPRNVPWARTGQHPSNVLELNKYNLCDPKVFAENVELKVADMNAIPDDLRDYDFTWSLCSLDHCGSIILGHQFLLNQMKCLKPGGIAVHTTAYNVSSNDNTIEEGGTSIWRQKDIMYLYNQMPSMEPLKFYVAPHSYNNYVAPPPYNQPCMRILLAGYIETSFGFIITRI